MAQDGGGGGGGGGLGLCNKTSVSVKCWNGFSDFF